jgi:hypothetical protein
MESDKEPLFAHKALLGTCAMLSSSRLLMLMKGMWALVFTKSEEFFVVGQKKQA